MWRVAITIKSKGVESINLLTKLECENWILEKLDKGEPITSSLIMNLDNKSERFLENWQ